MLELNVNSMPRRCIATRHLKLKTSTIPCEVIPKKRWPAISITLSIPLIIRFIRFKVLSTAKDIFCKTFNGFTALKIPVLGSKWGSIMLFWVYLPPNFLHIIQLHLINIVIHIFKTSDKFSGPKHPFRGQRRGSNMLFCRYLPPKCIPTYTGSKLFCYILYNFA